MLRLPLIRLSGLLFIVVFLLINSCSENKHYQYTIVKCITPPYKEKSISITGIPMNIQYWDTDDRQRDSANNDAAHYIYATHSFQDQDTITQLLNNVHPGIIDISKEQLISFVLYSKAINDNTFKQAQIDGILVTTGVNNDIYASVYQKDKKTGKFREIESLRQPMNPLSTTSIYDLAKKLFYPEETTFICLHMRLIAKDSNRYEQHFQMRVKEFRKSIEDYKASIK